jgi:hypothetical protein
MFLEIAQIDIKPGQEAEFEAGKLRVLANFRTATLVCVSNRRFTR